MSSKIGKNSKKKDEAMKKQLAKLCFFLLCIFTPMFVVGNISSAQTKKEKPKLQVEVVAEKEINGSFTANGRTIYFATKEGEPNLVDYPDRSVTNLDIRVMDQNGLTFLARIANHEPLGENQIEAETLYSDEDRGAAISMLPGLVKALKAYNNRHKQTRKTIKEVIEFIKSMTKQSNLATLGGPDSGMSAENTQSGILATGIYNYYVSIRWKSAFDVKLGNFQHSAVLLQIFDWNWAWKGTYVTCNHGTCSNDPSMALKCIRNFPKTIRNPFMWDYMCDSWGYPYETHLCNGDTRQEYLSIKYGTYSGPIGGSCLTPRLKAPDCE